MRKAAMILWAASLAVASLLVSPAAAQKKYGPGVTDTEIKIGNTGPYSGPVSAASTVSKTIGAYFDKVNAEQNGINGRKIKYVSLDDGYAPPRTVEQTRKLVEDEQVLALVGSVGTPTQLAVRKYLNDRGVPQLFVATGATAFFDPKNSPWSMGFAPSNFTEGRLVGKYVTQNMAGAKVAILYQNDDLGKEFSRGAKEILNGGQIVSEQSYEVTDPTVDTQIVTLQSSGATVLLAFATQKAAAQAIRKAVDIGWKPKIYIPSIVGSISQVLQPAGIENSVGVMTMSYVRDPTSPRWAGDPAVVEFTNWMKKYNTSVDINDSFAAASSYDIAQTFVAVLKACGDELTRENVIKQAKNIHALELGMLLPGITISTTPEDYRALKQSYFQYFDGKNWVVTGNIMSD